MSTTLTPPRPPAQQHVPPPPPPSRTPIRGGRIVLGAVLLLLGLGWMADLAGVVELRWQTVLAGGVLAIGVALLATAQHRAHGGLIALGLVLSVVLLGTSSANDVDVVQTFGQRSLHPTSAAELRDSYALGAGQLTLDLSDLRLPPGDTPVDVDVAMGEVVVRLPATSAAEIDADAAIGDIEVLDRQRGGVGVEVHESVPGTEGAGRVLLTVSIGMGRIEVSR